MSISASFDLDPVGRITAGAIGKPGERTFFVQARTGDQQVTLLVEREQVQVLAQALLQLLAQLPGGLTGAEPDVGELDLAEPLVPEWRAGEMSLEYDDAADRIAIVFREVREEEEGGEGEREASEPATARFVATREQVRALAMQGLAVVAAGRPRCPLCSRPMGPGGEHDCLARNGHRG